MPPDHPNRSAARCTAHRRLSGSSPGGCFYYERHIPAINACVSATVGAGIRANEPRIRELTERSLVLVTVLAPKIGYDRTAKIAKAAHANCTTLREEAVGSGAVTAAEFDRLIRPEKMERLG